MRTLSTAAAALALVFASLNGARADQGKNRIENGAIVPGTALCAGADDCKRQISEIQSDPDLPNDVKINRIVTIRLAMSAKADRLRSNFDVDPEATRKYIDVADDAFAALKALGASEEQLKIRNDGLFDEAGHGGGETGAGGKDTDNAKAANGKPEHMAPEAAADAVSRLADPANAADPLTGQGSAPPTKPQPVRPSPAAVVRGLFGGTASQDPPERPDPASSPVIRAVREQPSVAANVLDRTAGQSKDPNMQAIAAAAHELAGDHEGALAAAQRAVALDPTNPLARMIIGHPDEFHSAQAKLGALKDPFGAKGETPALGGEDGAVRVGAYKPDPAAQAAANRALAAMAAGVGPGVDLKTQSQQLLAEAVRQLGGGDVRGALFTISRALLTDPQNVRARILRAHISNMPANHNYEAAVQDADQALQLDPKSAAALFEKGFAELQLGKTADALRDIEDGLALEPNNAMGRYYHAMALEKQGLFAKAIEEYRRAEMLDGALKPLVEDALARLVDVKTQAPHGRLPLPAKPVLWLLALVTALALLLEGGKRVFYKDWKTTVDAKPDEALPMTARGTLSPGTVLGGNFRVEEELARGGIGIVYRATDITLKREVAIKHLRQQAYESAEVRERFLREAQLAAKLKHPNLAQIYSVVGDGELYLVFELVRGESLQQRLQKKLRLPFSEVKLAMRDVAAAVDYAHSEKVIHRDLKPANVMIEQGGRAKVMDFGIAHEARSMDSTQTAAWGTPPYMAPEQELGRVCRESDLYALGVMVYELVAGERPFKDQYMLDRKLKKEFRPIKHANPDAPDGLHAFFQKALEPEPEKRFRSAAELAAALEAIESTPLPLK